MRQAVLVEACVDSVDSALAAERGGALRLELCDSLHDGGTTPSAGMIAAVKSRVRIPVHVIIRPRGGGFVYSNTEIEVMRRDVAMAVQLGADGVVIGALGADACIEVGIARTLMSAAAGRSVAWHRAFDLCPDLDHALDLLLSLGISRVLTSGGARTALEGAETLASLVARARGRIAVMAGGGVREENVREIVQRTGVSEVHVRGTRLARTAMSPVNERVRFRKPMPDDEGAFEETDEDRVRTIVTLAAGAAPTLLAI